MTFTVAHAVHTSQAEKKFYKNSTMQRTNQIIDTVQLNKHFAQGNNNNPRTMYSLCPESLFIFQDSSPKFTQVMSQDSRMLELHDMK